MAEAIQDRPVPTERRARRVAHTVGARIARHWSHRRLRENRLLAYIGPGWITGASDDDPSGIATYSQAGAQFGYSMCWVMLFTWPLMAAIQEICARIGRVTGEGIAGNIRAHYAPWLLRSIVGLLVVANTINLGADLGAMGAATQLLVGGPPHLYVVAFALACALLEIFSRYERYASILKWTSLSLFAYVATALVVDVPWREVAFATFVPEFYLANRLHRDDRRRARHDDHPLLLFLAILRRGRRTSASIPPPTRCWRRRRKPQPRSSASASTPISAWDSPT